MDGSSRPVRSVSWPVELLSTSDGPIADDLVPEQALGSSAGQWLLFSSCTGLALALPLQRCLSHYQHSITKDQAIPHPLEVDARRRRVYKMTGRGSAAVSLLRELTSGQCRYGASSYHQRRLCSTTRLQAPSLFQPLSKRNRVIPISQEAFCCRARGECRRKGGPKSVTITPQSAAKARNCNKGQLWPLQQIPCHCALEPVI